MKVKTLQACFTEKFHRKKLLCFCFPIYRPGAFVHPEEDFKSLQFIAIIHTKSLNNWPYRKEIRKYIVNVELS